MSTTEVTLPVSIDELRDMLVESVEKFFETMVEQPASFEEMMVPPVFDELEGPPPPIFVTENPLVVGVVGFIGSLCGVIHLHFEEPVAMGLTGRFLGMTEEEVNAEGFEVVTDALGEVSNMVVGTFKNTLNDRGFPCRMTVPSIVRGTGFSIETPKGALRRVFRFRALGSLFFADLTMKPGE